MKIKRNIYQTSKGGKTYCPLEDNAWIIRGSTPKFTNINIPQILEHERSVSMCGFTRKSSSKNISFLFTGSDKDEISKVKQQYPDTLYLGIADGAKSYVGIFGITYRTSINRFFPCNRIFSRGISCSLSN